MCATNAAIYFLEGINPFCLSSDNFILNYVLLDYLKYFFWDYRLKEGVEYVYVNGFVKAF